MPRNKLVGLISLTVVLLGGWTIVGGILVRDWGALSEFSRAWEIILFVSYPLAWIRMARKGFGSWEEIGLSYTALLSATMLVATMVPKVH